MSDTLFRALSELPRVNQSDLLQLLDRLSQLSPKEHGKLYKSELKALPPAALQARLDVSTFRLERTNVIPGKTTIETLTLTNTHKATIHWKIQNASQVTSAMFLSCTPTSGKLEKGKSVEIRVCCVLLAFKRVLDFLKIECSIADNPKHAFIPILLHCMPNQERTREPYWSVDFGELAIHPNGLLDDRPITAAPIPSSSTPDSSASSSFPQSNIGIVAPAVPTTTTTTTKTVTSTSLFVPSVITIAPTLAEVSPDVSRGTAELYGTRVHIRRWNIGPLDAPPSACLDEIATLQQLSHPKLVSLVGGRAELGQAYVITRFVEGGTFEKYLKASIGGENRDLLKRLDMILDVAYGMAFLHGKNVLHLHLTTASMLIDEKRLKLGDFGRSFTMPVPVNCYMAPELYVNAANGCKESDVFSFGVCLWETVCCAKPYRSSAHIMSAVLPPISTDVSLLPDLVELINSCVRLDPKQRPTFSTIISELEGIRDSASSRTVFRLSMPRNKTLLDSAIASFPSTLVFLDLSSNVLLTDLAIPSLPRGLAHLDLSMCHHLSDDSIAYLPASLTHLDLSSATRLTDKAIPAMPRNLTFLSLRDNTNITEDSLINLPTGLLTINLLNASRLSESSLPKFPRSITDFVMPFAWIPAFKDENVKLLPPALTSLHFPTNTTITTSGLDHLPDSLRTINLAANASVGTVGLSVLPRNLESLNLSSATSLTDDGIQFLPKSLLHLNMAKNKNIGHLGVRVLPSRLLSLNLSGTQNLWDMSIRSLPRSLTVLVLSGNKQLTDEGIKDLPPSLTELSLAANTNFTDACANCFPDSLKILNLYWNNLWTDASIRALPRSLVELNLSSNQNFTDACIPDLPRSLRVLYFRKCAQITDNSIKYLPRSLTHLDLSAAHMLTDDCTSDMPTGLLTLEIWKNRNLSKENLRARLPSMKVLAVGVD